MESVVVAGGAGFIGSHCAEYFAQQGCSVIVIDNLSRGRLLSHPFSKANQNIDYLTKKFQNVTFYQEDLRNFEAIAPIVAQADAVIFAAGQTAVTTSLENPREDMENNLLTTFNVLEAIRLAAKNIPMLYCSTNKVFGDNVNAIGIQEGEKRFELPEQFLSGIPEDFPTDFCTHTPYGVSKFCADLYVQEYGRTYGINTAVFRMSCIYGTRQFGIVDQGWVVHIIARVLQDLPITIYGNGKQVRDLLYVTDLVNAMVKYFDKNSEIGSDLFCMGGGPDNSVSILELIEILENLSGQPIQCSFEDWRKADQKIYISDIRKAQGKLEWKPQTSVNEGLRLTRNWVAKNIHLFK